MRGMGAGSRIVRSAEDYERHFTPGHFWMTLLDGPQVSSDVAVVNGAAFGGAVGLVAACDIAVAAASARFSLSEVRLGLVPAMISPYVLRALGLREARRWCLTGETMSAGEAQRIGLADIVVADAALDDALAKLVDGLLMNAPGGLAASKKSIGENARPPLDRTIHERALAAFAAGRGSAQAKEGTAAFLAKRPPRWAERG